MYKHRTKYIYCIDKKTTLFLYPVVARIEKKKKRDKKRTQNKIIASLLCAGGFKYSALKCV